jgi:hypothetical protein
MFAAVIAIALCLVTLPLNAQVLDVTFVSGVRALTDDPDGSALLVLDLRATIKPAPDRVRPSAAVGPSGLSDR